MVKANRGPRCIYNTNLAIRVWHPELVFVGDSVGTSDISKLEDTASLASETNVDMVSQELPTNQFAGTEAKHVQV